jgi:tripeptide aminopeptidase
MSNYSPLIETFLELIHIDSETFSERKVADYIIAKLKPYVDTLVEDDAGKKLNGNAGNLIATVKGTRTDLPTIMLNAHMDTVKPGNGIKPVIEGDLIKSSGDTILGGDDKSGVAIILEIVRTLKEEKIPHGDLLLVFTVAEEIGIRGAGALDPKHLKADFGYTLDCTGPAGSIFVASPTHDKIEARIIGRAAHAGIEPEKGISAILIASNAISRMKLGRIDDETTANVGVIRGGHATNIIPESVLIEAEARSHDTAKLDAQVSLMRKALEDAASEAGAKIELKIIREYQNYKLTEDMRVIEVATAAARSIGLKPDLRTSGGGSDANIFNVLGLPTSPLGTAMHNCHTTNEDISISELEGVYGFVMAITKNPVA